MEKGNVMAKKKETNKEETKGFKLVSAAELMAQAPKMGKAECLAMDIAAEVAEKTAKKFRKLVEGLDKEAIAEIISTLEDADPNSVAQQLYCLFLLAGMEDEVEDLDYLVICSYFYEDAYKTFTAEFLEDEFVDWYRLENWLDGYLWEENCKLN